MNWKNLKDFIKPDWRKGIIFTGVLLFSALLAFLNPMFSSLFLLTHLMKYFQIGPIGIIFYLVVLVIYWQIIASFIIYIFDLFRRRVEFEKGVLIFLIPIVIFFLMADLPSYDGIPLTTNDFEIKSLEYTSVENDTGYLRLIIETKVDDVRISASSDYVYCQNEVWCGKAGECIMEYCDFKVGSSKDDKRFSTENPFEEQKFTISIAKGKKYSNYVKREYILPAYTTE